MHRGRVMQTALDGSSADPRRIAPGETFAFFAAMLRTERKTQQSSRLSDPVESCTTSVSQSVQQKSWAGGLKSQGAAGCNFVASPDHALGGRASSGRRARKRNRFNLKRSRPRTGSSPRPQLIRVLATDSPPLSGGGIEASKKRPGIPRPSGVG